MDLYQQNGAISRGIKDHKPEISIVALAVITYAVSLINTFHTDDWVVLSLLRDGFSWRDFLSMENMGRFRPLSNIVLYLRYLTFGDSPAGYYALNIALHAFFGVLLYRFLNKIGLKSTISLISALVFTVYFQHYEAVLWLYGIIRILLAIFWIACLWNLFDYLISGKRAMLMRFAIFSFLGYFVAEDFVVSPMGYLIFALLVTRSGKDRHALGPAGNSTSRIKVSMIISLTGLAIYFVLRSVLIVHPGVVENYYYPGLHVFSRLYAYLQWMILPPPSHPYFQGLAGGVSPIFILIWQVLSIASVLLLGSLLIYGLFKSPGIIKFMAIFILIALLPALPLSYKVTSRNIYIPSIGLSVLIGILFYNIYKRVRARSWMKFMAHVFLIAYLIANMTAVWVTSHEYRRNQTLVASLITDLRKSGIDFNSYRYVILDNLPGRTIVGPEMIYEMGYRNEVVASNDPSAPGPVDIRAAVRDIYLQNVPFVVFDYKNGHLIESTADYIKLVVGNESKINN